MEYEKKNGLYGISCPRKLNNPRKKYRYICNGRVKRIAKKWFDKVPSFEYTQHDNVEYNMLSNFQGLAVR